MHITRNRQKIIAADKSNSWVLSDEADIHIR